MAISRIPDDDQEQINFGDVTTPEETFEDFAATLPETASGFLDTPVNPPIAQSVGEFGEGSSVATGEPVPEKKTVKMSKNMKRAMTKFRKKIAEFPIAWFHQQAKDNPEWELDDDEKEMLTDSIGTVLELLDVEFAIEPLSIQLTSIWWVIGYPILTFLFLFLTKKSLVISKEQQIVTEDVNPSSVQ